MGANTNTGGTQLTTQNAVVQNGDTVQVNYRGTLPDGTEFDSSLKPDRTPLEFKVGAGQMIKGFDAAVVGMKLNEEKTVTMPPDQAYGFDRPELYTQVPKSALSSVPADQIQIGTQLKTQNGLAKISAISDENVTLNFNHELAGKTLTFWIKIVKITKK
ncbi:MAG: peptidylprolyl isomerase [Candidatus Diapherotrites archaeon]|nr:peptidylprolyl isomerase [Candidatus Diapherotrites archaeon]